MRATIEADMERGSMLITFHRYACRRTLNYAQMSPAIDATGNKQ
jgi:hypothetical protein